MAGGDDLRAAVEPLRKRFGAVMAVAVLPKSQALSARYGPSAGRLFLVRPDGYLGFKCRGGEVNLLEAHLASVLTGLRG